MSVDKLNSVRKNLNMHLQQGQRWSFTANVEILLHRLVHFWQDRDTIYSNIIAELLEYY